MRFWWRVFPIAGALLLAPAALGQSLDAATEARRTALFEEGRTLHLKGQHAEAIEKLSEVVRLRRSPQALRALGLAEAAAGKLATARAHLQQAIDLAAESGPPAEVGPARTALAEVSPRVPKLRVVLPAGATEVTLLLDEARIEIGRAAGGELIEVDVGVHTITARTADKADFVQTVQASEGAVSEVKVVFTARAEGGSSMRRPLGIGLAAVGAGGLVLGAVTGVLAIGAHDDLGKKCPSGACPDSAKSALDSYHALGIGSTVGFVAGGVLAAAGAVIFFTAPRPAASAKVQITPYVGLGSAGAIVVF